MTDVASKAQAAKQLRSALASWVTGVTAVCSRSDTGEPIGLAVNSFTSVSLDPPLVSFCITTESRTLPQLARFGHFAVSVLAAGHAELCRQLSGQAPDRFDGISWAPAPSGAPVIDGALAWFDCTVAGRHPAGDHEIVLGQVDAFAAVEGEHGPLVFYRSQLRDL
jgi:3-hydroxy-9,10-secoandrosta-1,3,5(10)-triene-9,17-dione monooxygenase reductase component